MRTTRPPLSDSAAATGTAVAFLFGSAIGFEHTVTVAARNGAGPYWDIGTAVCVEVLAVTGGAMWASFTRRGWPTAYPFALVVLGVLMTFGAQIAYRAAPDPNSAIGYVVTGTPTFIALVLLFGIHLAHGYGSAHSATPAADVPAVVVPDAPATVATTATKTRVPAAKVVVPQPPRATPPAPGGPTPDQLAELRNLPTNPRTGRPSIKAVRDHFGIGQPKAYELIEAAYGNTTKTTGREQEAAEKDQNHDQNQSVGKDEGGEARGENEPSHPCNSVDQGSEPTADAPEAAPLRLVKDA